MFSKWWIVIALVAGACAKGTTADVGDDARRQDAQETADCGDGQCGEGEACDVCVADCGACSSAPGCGDGMCGPTEDCNSCPSDCGPCGSGGGATNGAITAGPATTAGVGGGYGGYDGSGGAGGGFTVMCGDGYCDPPEDEQSCPQDCQQGGGTCAHDYCQEGVALDAQCDICVDLVCTLDAFCCNTEWDDACVGNAEIFCGCP